MRHFYHLAKFVEIGLTLAEISQFFRVFLVKCKHSTNDRA